MLVRLVELQTSHDSRYAMADRASASASRALIERCDRVARELREHKRTAHLGACLEQLLPVIGALPEHFLEVRQCVRIAPGELAGEGIEAAVERVGAVENARIESVLFGPSGTPPLGVDRHAGEATEADLLFD